VRLESLSNLKKKRVEGKALRYCPERGLDYCAQEDKVNARRGTRSQLHGGVARPTKTGQNKAPRAGSKNVTKGKILNNLNWECDTAKRQMERPTTEEGKDFVGLNEGTGGGVTSAGGKKRVGNHLSRTPVT